jgi:hypothetical protein
MKRSGESLDPGLLLVPYRDCKLSCAQLIAFTSISGST